MGQQGNTCTVGSNPTWFNRGGGNNSRKIDVKKLLHKKTKCLAMELSRQRGGENMEREEEIEKALEHFGIMDSGSFTVAGNNERVRKSFGIDTVTETRNGEKGKFRITTYYDSECPLIIRTVSKVE